MSVRVWLVRHGEPERVGHLDPGLTALGHRQARAFAQYWSDRVPAADRATIALRTSPLRRARETLAPLVATWNRTPVIDPAMRELPSAHLDGDSRRAWLQMALVGTFADLDDEQRRWRDEIVAAMTGFTTDTIVTTHAVVINAVLGNCSGDDAVLSWVPDHASTTELRVDESSRIVLVERGAGRQYGTVT